MDEFDLFALLNLPPEQIIEQFQAKGFAFSWDWQDLWQQAHSKAFTVAKVLREDILADIREAVEAALAEGQTLSEFRRELEPKLKTKGWWGKVALGDGDGGVELVQLGSPWRLATIYRTNLQTSYMAGRWAAFSDNTSRPYLQYVAVLDARTRPAHRGLHNKVFHIGDPFWRDFYPPNGWGCRCRTRALSAADAAERGFTIATSSGRLGRQEVLVSRKTGEVAEVATYELRDMSGKTSTISPDPGWSYNPGVNAFPPGSRWERAQ